MPLSDPVVFGLALVGYWIALYVTAKISILFYSYIGNGGD